MQIPSSVTEIGTGVFSYCDSLSEILVAEENKSYKSIDGNLYTKDGSVLFQYAVGKSEKSFTVSSEVSMIADRAFIGAEHLEEVVFENPNGWRVVDDSTPLARGRAVWEHNLKNPKKALTLLTEKYELDIWKSEG